MDESAMTVREVAAYLSFAEKTIYRLTQKGELPGFMVKIAQPDLRNRLICPTIILTSRLLFSIDLHPVKARGESLVSRLGIGWVWRSVVRSVNEG